jgi:tetratricopeptide (TPR) repeat protein
MRLLPVMGIALFFFPAAMTGLRELHPGDMLPKTETMEVFKSGENKLILFIDSLQDRSVVFFDQLAGIFKGKEKIGFFLVDSNPMLGAKADVIFQKLDMLKKYIPDQDRKLYGELGIIVLPTLVLVDSNDRLHSVISGFRDNLPAFFQSYLQALLAGQPPQDVYQAAGERQRQEKLSQALQQAHILMVNEDYPLAFSAYKKALGIDPDSVEAFLGMGYSLFFQDKIDESLAKFTELKQKNENKAAFLGYYLCQAEKGLTEDVLTGLSKSYTLETIFFSAVFKAALVLEKAGKCDQSREAMRLAYEILLRNYRRRH